MRRDWCEKGIDVGTLFSDNEETSLLRVESVGNGSK